MLFKVVALLLAFLSVSHAQQLSQPSPSDLANLAGEITIADPSDLEREDFLFSICYNLENLFAHSVKCDCSNPSLKTFTIPWTCYDRSKVHLGQDIEFVPAYNGYFRVKLAGLGVGLASGGCAGNLTFDTLDYGEINFKDFCFQFQFSLGLSPAGLAVDGCELSFGTLGKCTTCTPCTTTDGKPGVAFNCPKPLDRKECYKINAPMSSTNTITGKPFQMSDFFDQINLRGMLEEAIDDGLVELPEKRNDEDNSAEEEQGENTDDTDNADDDGESYTPKYNSKKRGFLSWLFNMLG